jgi:hypothetical protein
MPDRLTRLAYGLGAAPYAPSGGPGMSEGLARADAVLRLAHAHWVSYGGGEAILLAIVHRSATFLAIAGSTASASCSIPAQH